LPPRFVLHVGTLQPRKNIPVLLEAMARLPKELANIPLVLVGGKGWLYDQIFQRVNELGLQGRVHFAGYVADEALPLWYNAASVLVLPSVYEGFGLPIVEALACGTPVIAANVSALPEAAGDAGLFFEPHDAPTLAGHLATLLSNSDLAATMREQGLVQVRHFSWERSGREMLTTYRTALAAQS
jgi:glycosyltransferase involved in cell wall biosynthesis